MKDFKENKKFNMDNESSTTPILPASESYPAISDEKAHSLVPKSSKNLPASLSTKIEKSSPLQLYLAEISKYPLLTPEEEYKLAVAHYEYQDPKAAHTLITSNLRLVVKIANDFKQTRLNILDLIQEGNFGLMQAVKKFNPYKGVKLSSYSAWWIRAYILKYIMDNKSQVRIGTTAAQRKLFYNLEKETQKLLQETSSLDVKFLAESLNVKENDIIEMQQRLATPEISLESPSDDSSQPIINTLQDHNPLIDEILADSEIKTLFQKHLSEFQDLLNDREKQIFNERLLNDNPLTLQQIADKYSITRERVRQIESKIIKKLKDFVSEKGLIDIHA